MKQNPAGIRSLNERSREIFRQIVESYLTTGEPVGSRNLSRTLPITLSPQLPAGFGLDRPSKTVSPQP